MTLEDVKALVEWKLYVFTPGPFPFFFPSPPFHHSLYTQPNDHSRHGKFRPTLMSLVSSNDAKTTQKTIQTALASYGGDGSATKAAAALTALRGIGPATASLLVAVHDGERAPFFSDEVFSWLCCDGQAAPSIKYNAKEYGALCAQVAEVRERLGVAAVDIERVAFVLLRGDQGGGGKVAREDGKGSQAVAGKKGPKKGGDEVEAEPRSVKPAAGKKGPKKGGDEVKAEQRPVKPAAAVGKPTTKRKKSEESRGAEAAEPSRRSKRGKHS